MKLRTSTISIMIEQGLTNLPVLHNSFVSEKAKQGLGSLLYSGLSQMRIPVFDFLGEINKVVSSIFTQSKQTFFPSFLFCWQFREQKFDIPSEGTTIVALEAWYQYVLGPGTHA
jgi:hypothetical protein